MDDSLLLSHQVLCVSVLLSQVYSSFWLTSVTIKAPPGKYPVCNTATFALDGLFLDVVKFDVMLLFGELPWLNFSDIYNAYLVVLYYSYVVSVVYIATLNIVLGCNRLDVYIYDYLVKRDLKATAQAFQAEGKVSSDPVGKYITNLLEFSYNNSKKSPLFCIFSPNELYILLALFYIAIDAPGGFLFEWWSVFWDIFIARTNEKHSEVAASYIEVPFFVLHLCKAVVSDIKVS